MCEGVCVCVTSVRACGLWGGPRAEVRKRLAPRADKDDGPTAPPPEWARKPSAPMSILVPCISGCVETADSPTHGRAQKRK